MIGILSYVSFNKQYLSWSCKGYLGVVCIPTANNMWVSFIYALRHAGGCWPQPSIKLKISG
jgi:hypothetical protein